ncbi:MAG: chromosome segregation protein SMC [Lachnospiraceae bacterium]|nr:chromosome segregation protein SMC [Lachnospiraceae bacterium]
MYLKSIEVYGFKSFANKIRFEFHNGITGIVGPNGSGKSNVADAVRWVLGEQSAKQLRGASMQDVIFSGTELRKPMGSAYVAITLDNSDHKLPVEYEEVTVQRRVYRSGESEYLINGVTCRLKDVYEMFYDTGIGKEGYSIIGQGQIDKILSGKPEERRELFDEAAGVVKFKRRKAAAIKKLESEKLNLEKVSITLSELERQVGPLKEQSDVAREYLDKKEKLKNLDINLFLLDSERYSEQSKANTEKLSVANSELDEAKGSFESNKGEYGALSEAIRELDEEIQKKQKALSESGLLKEKLEGEIKLSRERINSARHNIEMLSEQRQSALDKSALQERERERLTVKLSELEEEFSVMESESKAKKEVLSEVQNSIKEFSDNVTRDNEEVVRIVRERASVKEEIGRYDTMLEQAKLRRADIQSQLIKAKTEEAEHEKTMKELYTELNDISAQILKTDTEISEREDGLKSFKQRLEEQDNERQEAYVEYNRRKSRLDAVKNIAERYEGYGNSIRRVMEKKDKGNGRVIGVVADILNVEKKYETAIETALGGNIQNIITEDDATAKQMIQFLKDNKYGRATFMPLTSVRGRGEYKRPEVRDEKGFLGIASELVAADRKYDEVVSQLLGEIVIIDKYDNARNIARKYEQKLRLVTLEGEYFTPGGSVSGGAFQNSSNLLGRKREIDKLTEDIEAARKRIDAAEKALEDIKAERTKERGVIEQLREKLQELSIKQNTAQVNVDAANERKASFSEDFDRLNSLSEDLEKQLLEISGNKESIYSRVADSEKREKELNEEIAELGKKIYDLREKENAHVLGNAELDRKLSRLAGDKEYTRKDIERADQSIEAFVTEVKDLSERIENENKEILIKEEDIKKIEETIKASGEKKDDSEEEIEALKNKKGELTKKQEDSFKQNGELQSRISALEKEVYRLTTACERIEEEQEKQINFMWDEYKMTLSSAKELRDETLNNPSVIKREIYSARESIKALGEVNVNAIEQYKEVMERYTFLKKQHDDLIEAEKTLQGIIEDLDTAMRSQFSEKFNEIAAEFDSVFKEMFGGGKGTLELAEGEDILEAGIKVIAQPPGKKLQNMMQLSGGEKALTAIALLFAIQNLKPSPFCLLDEIEAALDESNVGRFAGYLNKLTEHTQFIVITHRRGTMEKADRLYGITMQEKGVSALVSVSLIDKELED